MSALGKKIMIVGSGGSGKSTLARKLGEILSLPVIHLDKEFWNAGWIETPKEEWYSKQESLFSGDEWIADGNYGWSMEIRLKRADTLIFLDFNRFVCIYSVIKRRLINIGKTRPDIAVGCPEKIDFMFLKWLWLFPKKSRPTIIEAISRHREMNVIVLKKRHQLTQFLMSISCTE